VWNRTIVVVRRIVVRTATAWLAGVLAVCAVLWPVEAFADCSGPTIELQRHDVARGDTLEVVGTAWGTDCYDTGPPPSGVGVLGAPVSDIELVVVQADREWVVARGAAGSDYTFVVTVTVPTDATPGTASLVGRHPGGTAYSPNQELQISELPAATGSPTVATFGPVAATTSSLPPTTRAATTATAATPATTATSADDRVDRAGGARREGLVDQLAGHARRCCGRGHRLARDPGDPPTAPDVTRRIRALSPIRERAQDADPHGRAQT
jgi:hypothetical protein